MAGHGAPVLEVTASDLRVGVIAAQWHTEVMDGLLDGALRAVDSAGATATVVRVPGAFELPVACARLADKFDVLVALGVVIRGGTPHFDYVCAAATHGITDVSIATGKPIGFGLLTCDTEKQALDRAGLPGSAEDKGLEAAQAAIATYQVLHAV